MLQTRPVVFIGELQITYMFTGDRYTKNSTQVRAVNVEMCIRDRT